MDKILKIIEKYDANYVQEGLGSLEGLNQFTLTFYKSVAKTCDCLTLLNGGFSNELFEIPTDWNTT